MNPIVESKRVEVAELCRRLGVQRLELFGSATRSDFDEASSDFDFLVEFREDLKGSPLGTWFGLKGDLEAMFGRPVDLVSLDAVANPFVRDSILKSRQVVYAA